MAQSPPFHSIGNILSKFFANAKWDSKRRQYALWEQWDTIVGTPIASQATPLRWSRNMLVVGVSDACWLQELRMMEREIVAKIRHALPEISIDRIRWTLK